MAKNRPSHFSEQDPDKSRKQLTREKMQIRIRKLKRPNIFLVLVTIVVLVSMFFVTSYVIPAASSASYSNSKDTVLQMDFLGDVMFGRNIQTIGETYGYDKLFANVKPYLEKSDLVFANLENAVLEDDASTYEKTPKKTKIYLGCTQEAVDAARDAGINVFGCANNHMHDFGERPIEELIKYFRENEVYYSGIGLNSSDAAQYTIMDVKGYRIAFVSIMDMYVDDSYAMPDRAGVLSTKSYGDYNMLVHNASEKADITIVYIHWGKETDIARNKDQRRMGHRLIDAGADVIIGAHPHVLQEVETYKDGIIFYSLGNFIFDQGSTFNNDSMILRMSVNKKGKAYFTALPVRIKDGIPYLTDNLVYKTRINHELTQSLKKTSYTYNDDGNLKITLKKQTFNRTAEEKQKAESVALAASESIAVSKATEPVVTFITDESVSEPNATEPLE